MGVACAEDDKSKAGRPIANNPTPATAEIKNRFVRIVKSTSSQGVVLAAARPTFDTAVVSCLDCITDCVNEL